MLAQRFALSLTPMRRSSADWMKDYRDSSQAKNAWQQSVSYAVSDDKTAPDNGRSN